MWLALVALVGHLMVMGLYGHHRDELYLWACGRHLDWGAVDHGPLLPLLARVHSFGDGAWCQRIGPALAAAGVVWLTAHSSRLLGADRRGQAIAAVAVLAAPTFVWSGGVFGANAFDQLTWIAAGVAWLHVAAGRRNAWFGVGLAWGAGMLLKPTALLGAIAFAVAIVQSPVHRRALRRVGPYAAAAIAALLTSPIVAWQIAHDWPSIEFAAEHASAARERWTPLGALVEQPLLLGPLAATLVIAGALRARGEPTVRILAVALFVVLAAVLLLGGKPYYVAPAYPWLIASGAAPASRLLGSLSVRWRRAAWTAAALVAAGTWLVTLPILPRPFYRATGIEERHREMVQFVDWPALAAGLARIGERHGAGAVLTDSYGTAAAVERNGGTAICGDNSYFIWGPPDAAADRVLALGYSPVLLASLFRSVRVVGELEIGDTDNRFDLPRTVYLCQGLLGSWRAAWPRLRATE